MVFFFLKISGTFGDLANPQPMCIYRYTCTALGISKTNALPQNSWLGIYIELPITGFSNPGDMGNHNSRVCGIQTCPAFLLLCVPILGFSVVNCDVRYLLLGCFFFFFLCSETGGIDVHNHLRCSLWTGSFFVLCCLPARHLCCFIMSGTCSFVCHFVVGKNFLTSTVEKKELRS